MAEVTMPRQAGERVEIAVGAAGKPRHSIHPFVIVVAMTASVWFVISMAISFSGGVEADYLMGIVAGFSVIFFTLVLGLANYAAARSRGGEPAGRLDEFLDEDVAINTGPIGGREAMVQLLTLPISLAVGATLIGIVFVIGA